MVNDELEYSLSDKLVSIYEQGFGQFRSYLSTRARRQPIHALNADPLPERLFYSNYLTSCVAFRSDDGGDRFSIFSS